MGIKLAISGRKMLKNSVILKVIKGVNANKNHIFKQKSTHHAPVILVFVFLFFLLPDHFF